MSQDTISSVKEFQLTYGQPVLETPSISDKEVANLRVSLLQEELNELAEAIDTNDIVGVLDALTDLQYVLDGTYLSFGLHDLKQVAFAEVHSSNMSKLGEDGKPIYRDDGKILKGPNYFKPNLQQFFS